MEILRLDPTYTLFRSLGKDTSLLQYGKAARWILDATPALNKPQRTCNNGSLKWAAINDTIMNALKIVLGADCEHG